MPSVQPECTESPRKLFELNTSRFFPSLKTCLQPTDADSGDITGSSSADSTQLPLEPQKALYNFKDMYSYIC